MAGPDANTLGEYLRARRERVDPADVGLRVTGARRTPGLRREEVATLAGISADYYLRLEQGRDRNPSPPVLESLARVYRLDPAATRYLLSLAAGPPRAPRPPSTEAVPPGIRALLGTLGLPAFVENRAFDVLAANAPATALSPRIRSGRNRLRDVFLDDDERALFPDWDEAAVGMVAAFRSSVGTDVDDPDVRALVGDLSAASERFRDIWARHDVVALAGGAARFRHPRLGPLELHREKLAIGDSSGQLLVIYHAEPGTDSERSLRLLDETATAHR
ncbi:helix-turn-helix domain-containing protein [Cryptosporangium phraense]|uniref:Helix-turn-helix domain-containing protein n=1 Tax=Cryptosporangium phraense TaxID=2593070 RepID=A0A545AVT9_9ACTN|nr:helix-turn-helix transcriptional regulator [Cryptosporangium phraense]TQS44715.1 helix-turn-helix domain-containing protein [Cryptosporangium phraense]